MARLSVTASLSIDEAELTERFVLSSGPGGQNVNKVSTAVELRFDARAPSPSLPDGVKARLIRIAGSRMTQDGVIVISAQTLPLAATQPGGCGAAAVRDDTRGGRAAGATACDASDAWVADAGAWNPRAPGLGRRQCGGGRRKIKQGLLF